MQPEKWVLGECFCPPRLPLVPFFMKQFVAWTKGSEPTGSYSPATADQKDINF